MSQDTLDLSAVIPVFNEAGNVAAVHADVTRVFAGTGQAYEVLFVNDGSTDETGERLTALRASDEHVRILELDGNFGEAAALSTGLRYARGNIVITLDGDGQNDPADIPHLLAALGPGHAAASGWRQKRSEPYWTRVFPSRVANRFIAALTGVRVHDCGCGLKAYRRDRLSGVALPPGMNRFLPAVLGFRAEEVVEVPVRDRPRKAGSSHYGLKRIWPVLRDLPVLPFVVRRRPASAVRPLWVAAVLGVTLTGAAVALSVTTGPRELVVVAALSGIVSVVAGLALYGIRRFLHVQSKGACRIRELI